MPDNTIPADVRADIQGDVSGQVAVGSYIVQVGSVHGGVVNISTAGQTPTPRPRPSPVLLRPRAFSGLIGRKDEIGTVRNAFRDGMCVDLLGEPGLGKTALVRTLVHQSSTDQFPDGIVYLSARNQLPCDLCQSIYDAFYECEIPFKPTDSQLRHAFQSKNALIVLDDIEQERDDLEGLINLAPVATFVFCSAKRRVWREVQGLPIHGLKSADAIALIERELDRELTPEERAAGESVSTALGGHPLRIIQEAARVRDEGLSLAQVAAENRGAAAQVTHDNQTVAPRPPQEQQALAAMAALGGATLTPEALAAIAQLANAASAIQTLQAGYLAQANSPRYNLTGSLAVAVEKAVDLDPYRDRAVTYFADWAESVEATPERMRLEVEGILCALEWGASTGRHAEVLRLSRAIEETLIERGHWDAWERTINWNLEAARALNDQPAEARAIHQQGTRLLCLGNKTHARTFLLQALTMRMGLGDTVGAAVTRHHLEVIEASVENQLVQSGGIPMPPPGFVGRGGRKGMATAGAAGATAVVMADSSRGGNSGKDAGKGGKGKRSKKGSTSQGLGGAVSTGAQFLFKTGLAVAAVVGLAAGGLYTKNRITDEMHFNTCMANCKAIGNALAMYAEDNDETMIPSYTGSEERPISWAQNLVPFLQKSSKASDAKPEDIKKALLCPSFDFGRVSSVLATEDCMQRGSLGSSTARDRQADYGIGGGETGGNCAPQSPYYVAAGSGPSKRGMRISNVVRQAETISLTDGFTGIIDDANGSMRSVMGCTSIGSHKGGGNHLFLDGHAKFFAKNSEQVTAKDQNGCTYKTYYTVDR